MLVRCPIALILVFAALTTTRANAQDRSPQPAEHWKPYAFLIGGSWVGTFPDGKTTDEHRFEWMYDGKFIRDRHIVKGSGKPYEGETVYGWNASTKQVVFWYWANNGGFSQGHVKIEENRFLFAEQYEGEESQEMKTVWEKISDHAYDTHTYAKQNGEWKKLWTISFERKTDQDQADREP